MRPRPSVVSFALATIALLHAYWGVRMLLNSALVVAASQLVSAGALLLAAAGAADRRALAFGLGLAALATAARLPVVAAGGFGPFSVATLVLVAGFALAAWGAARLDAGRASWEPLALRGGLTLAGLGYLAFLGLRFANGNTDAIGTVDFVARALAAFAAAAWIDAPPAQLARRKAFSGEPSSPSP